MINAMFAELNNLKLGIATASVQAAAAETARISMENCERVTLLLYVGAGTGADIKVNIKQHKLAAAGTPAAMTIAKPVYVKAGSATVFTKTAIPFDAPLSTIELAALDADTGIALIEVQASDLNVNEGYKYVSFEVPIAGAAKNVTAFLIAGVVGKLPAYENAI